MSVEEQEPMELVTGGSIAKRLGVSRERVRQLAARLDFPRPLGRLGSANVWRWDAVDEWRQTNERPPAVEIESWTDDVVTADRNVWYQVKWGDRRYEKSTDYGVVLKRAEALSSEHNTGIIDRSDKGSGFLLATLGRGPLIERGDWPGIVAAP